MPGRATFAAAAGHRRSRPCRDSRIPSARSPRGLRRRTWPRRAAAIRAGAGRWRRPMECRWRARGVPGAWPTISRRARRRLATQHRARTQRQLRFAQMRQARISRSSRSRSAGLRSAHGGSSLPGLRMPSGSNTAFSCRISASVGGVDRLRHEVALGQADAVLARQRAAQRQRQREHARQRGVRALRPAPASAGSNRMLTCRLPLPAWPKHDDRQREFARQRLHAVDQCRDARHRHHHVLVDLARRQRAQRRRQRLARGPQRSRVRPRRRRRRSTTRPSPSAARVSASIACGSVSASPSASIISSAPASAAGRRRRRRAPGARSRRP